MTSHEDHFDSVMLNHILDVRHVVLIQYFLQYIGLVVCTIILANWLNVIGNQIKLHIIPLPLRASPPLGIKACSRNAL